MHIFIKYTVIIGYTANGSTKINGINLHFPEKNKIGTKHLTYHIAVLSFIIQLLFPRFSDGHIVNASFCSSVRPSFTLSPPKPLGGIQPNLLHGFPAC